MENVSFVLEVTNSLTHIAVIYWTPRATKFDPHELLKELLLVTSSRKMCVVVGDFNLPNIC